MWVLRAVLCRAPSIHSHRDVTPDSETPTHGLIIVPKSAPKEDRPCNGVWRVWAPPPSVRHTRALWSLPCTPTNSDDAYQVPRSRASLRSQVRGQASTSQILTQAPILMPASHHGPPKHPYRPKHLGGHTLYSHTFTHMHSHSVLSHMLTCVVSYMLTCTPSHMYTWWHTQAHLDTHMQAHLFTHALTL